ncbi:MAG: hypothetical protein BAJATHORv1_80002 [Candidatus Thorarchaeota archaeon]|nr:MAG: hypothetical protein BAJATHORv1_80002 [Candidatus Thorarchaeota archaeon]
MQIGDFLEGVGFIFALILAGIVIVIGICMVGCEMAQAYDEHKEIPEEKRGSAVTEGAKGCGIICIVFIVVIFVMTNFF